MYRIIHKLAAIALASSFLLSGCGIGETPKPETPMPAAPPVTDEIPAPEQTPPKPEFVPKELTFLAVGDNIIHNTVYWAAETKGGYDFRPMYEPVKALIEQAGLAFVNQEAPMGGEGYKASSYPNFNSPQQVGDALIDAGFDVVNLANNHMMDSGKGAVHGTIEYWKQHPEVLTCGVYESEQDRAAPRFVTKDGVTVGFLSYTYGLNGIPLPKDEPYLVSLIDRDAIKRDMLCARPLCDALIVSMHWGQEYQHTPNDEQKELAQLLADYGADVVVGTHPHVIQGAEFLTGKNGNKTFVAYSLGNFLSSQDKPMTMLGGMLRLTLKTKEEGGVTVESPTLMPVITYYKKRHYRVYPIYDYTDALASTHSVRSKGDVSPAAFKKKAKSIFGEFYIDVRE